MRWGRPTTNNYILEVELPLRKADRKALSPQELCVSAFADRKERRKEIGSRFLKQVLEEGLLVPDFQQLGCCC